MSQSLENIQDRGVQALDILVNSTLPHTSREARISILIAFAIMLCCIVVVIPCIIVNLIIWRLSRKSRRCSAFCSKLNNIKKNTTLGFWCFLIVGIILLPFLLIVYCVSCKCFGDFMECCFELSCDFFCDILFAGDDSSKKKKGGILEESEFTGTISTNTCNFDVINTKPITARLQSSVETNNDGSLYYTLPISKRVLMYPKKIDINNYFISRKSNISFESSYNDKAMTMVSSQIVESDNFTESNSESITNKAEILQTTAMENNLREEKEDFLDTKLNQNTSSITSTSDEVKIFANDYKISDQVHENPDSKLQSKSDSEFDTTNNDICIVNADQQQTSIENSSMEQITNNDTLADNALIKNELIIENNNKSDNTTALNDNISSNLAIKSEQKNKKEKKKKRIAVLN